MPITPEQYASTPAYDLLDAAARGHLGLDHRFLHAILDHSERSIPGLIRFAFSRRDDRVDLEEDLILITRSLHATEMIPFLVERASHYSQDVPEILVETLCGFHEAALEPLLELYRTTGPDAGTEIPFLLAALGLRDARIEEVLNEVSKHDPEEAAFCLDIYNEIARGSEDIEPFDIWAEYPPVEDPPLYILPLQERVQFLESPSAEHRTAAAGSLLNEINRPVDVLRKLVHAAKHDPEPRVRAACWRSLAVEVDNQSLHHEMRDRLFDSATPLTERAGLIVGLAGEAGEDKVRQHVLELLDAPETRAAALEAIWRSTDKSFTPYVKRCLDDCDPNVREQAIMGVAYLDIASELDRLKAMFDDPDLRPVALLAYALVVPCEIAPERFRSLFRKIEELAATLAPEEAEIVHLALDNRLSAHGQEPIYHTGL